MVKRRDYEKIDPEMVRAIGLCSIAFSQVEYGLELLFEALTGLDEVDDSYLGEIIFDSVTSFTGRLNLVRTLFKRKYGNDGFDKFKDVFSRAEKANVRRNEIMHSYWEIKVGGELVRHRRQSSSMESSSEVLASAAEFDDTANLLGWLGWRVATFPDKLPTVDDLLRAVPTCD